MAEALRQVNEGQRELRTAIGWADSEHIYVRGQSLTEELMGKASYTQVVFLALTGRFPTEAETQLLDAVLVSLVDHGLNVSTVAARVTYSIAPEAIQAAVAAGLLTAGSLVLGAMENCGKLLSEIARRADRGEDTVAVTRVLVEEHVRSGRRIPGLGHTVHRRGDPRAERLMGLAEELGFNRRYLQLLRQLQAEAERATGRSLPINVTGAIAAVLLEMGFEWPILRGFALISRVGGLVAHVQEERHTPITPAYRRLILSQAGAQDESGRG